MKQKSNFPGLFSLAFLLLIVMNFAAFDLQQQRTNAIRLNKDERRAIQLLPIIQEQIRPVNVAEKFIRQEISGILQVGEENAQKLLNNFKKAFGSSFSLLLIDHDQNEKASFCSDPQTLNDFRIFAGDVYGYHLFNRPKPSKHTLDFLEKVFDQTVSFEFLPNFINITSCRMNGVPGIAVVATLVTPQTPKSIRKIFAQVRPKEDLSKSYKGSLVAFIPESSFCQIGFLQRYLQIEKDFSLSFMSVGKIGDVAKALKQRFSPELAEKFIKKTTSNHQAVLQSENQIIGFTRSGLEQSFTNVEELVIAFAILPANRSFLEEHAQILILMLANFLLFLFFSACLYQTTQTWEWKLQFKFVALALSACLFPVAGLLYQNKLQWELQENANERKILAELENKIEIIENGHLAKKNELATMLQILNRKIDHELPADAAIIEEEAERLNSRNVIQIYFANRDGSIESLDTRKSWTTEDTRAGTRVVKALLRFIIDNLKLNFAGNSENKDIDKEGFLIESVAEALGVETLYELAINQQQFLPFKLSHGSVWAYVDLQSDRNNKPTRLILHVVNRNEFTQNYIDSLQMNQNQNEPQLFFMNRSMMQIEKLAPTLLETCPELVNILKTANSAGGSMQLKAESSAHSTLIVARQLKGMNWSCLALQKREKHSFAAFSTFAFLSAAIMLYLLILILFLSDWLRQFFLKPVLELNANANAIAAGNYQIETSYKSNDELGFLSVNFSGMARELEEKEYLNRFLSDIARDAISGQTTTRATKIEATVLFSDIRSFTSLSESYPPEQIGQMLNDYMTFMEEIIENHGGSIEKFIGDAVMAVFLPRMGMAHPAFRATMAAKEMIIALENFNARRTRQNLFTVSNGFGIAHGELLMGTMGNLEGRRDYTVTGKTVNIAAEMEKLSKNTTRLPIVLCPVARAVIAEQKVKNAELNIEIAARKAYELL